MCSSSIWYHSFSFLIVILDFLVVFLLNGYYYSSLGKWIQSKQSHNEKLFYFPVWVNITLEEVTYLKFVFFSFVSRWMHCKCVKTVRLRKMWEGQRTRERPRPWALRWCYTRPFATMIFSATRLQLYWYIYNIVSSLQAMLHLKSSLPIVPCNITFRHWEVSTLVLCCISIALLT